MRHLFNIMFGVLTTLCWLSAAADDAAAVARYDSGHKLYVNGDYREAAKAFVDSHLLADSPEIRANSLIAQIGAYRMCGLIYEEFTAIEKLLDKYIEFADYQALSERQFEIGDAFHSGKREPAFWALRWVPWLLGPDYTEEVYTKALKRSPFSPRAPQALLRLAHWYEMEGKSDKSLETLRKLLKDHPESKEYDFALLALGNGLLEIARCGGDGDGLMVAEAVKVLQLFVDRCPQAPEAEFAKRKIARARDIQSERLYQMADYYRGKGHTEVATRYLAQLVQKYPDSSMAESAEKELADMDKSYLPGDFAPAPAARLMPVNAYEIPESAEKELISPLKPGSHYLISVPDLKSSSITSNPTGAL